MKRKTLGEVFTRMKGPMTKMNRVMTDLNRPNMPHNIVIRDGKRAPKTRRSKDSPYIIC